MEVIGNMGSKVLMLERNSMFYVYKHKSRTWKPSLENWGRWVKDLLWLANSPPHIRSHRLSCKIYSLQYCTEVITITYLRLSGGLAILWFY